MEKYGLANRFGICLDFDSNGILAAYNLHL